MITLALIMLSSKPVYAIEHMRNYVPDIAVVGEGRLTKLFWDIYDARLYAPHGKWNSNKPFALEISYIREIRGKTIADQSIKEMRTLGFNNEIKLASWHSQIKSIFPDVKTGSKLTGIYTTNKETVFYSGDDRIGVIKDPEFGRLFFGIWLDRNTTAPRLRNQLLGAL